MAIGYEMKASIALDTMQANKNANDMQAALRATINTMKAVSAQSNATGDALGAQSTKVEGYGKAIELANSKIEILRAKQNDLDTSTAAGARAFERYESQIASTERSISSYTAKQDQAKQSLVYYSNGLADLQRSYQTTIDKTEAYSQRLSAEGDKYGAVKAKVSGYKDALTNLNEQYSKQSSELGIQKDKVALLTKQYDNGQSALNRMRDAGMENTTSYQHQSSEVDKLKVSLDKANEAMTQQSIRVNKTGTSIAQTKTKVSELSTEMNKEAPQTLFSSIVNGFHKTDSEADKSKSHMSTAMSYFTGGALLSGVQTVTSAIVNQAKASYDSAKAVSVGRQRWQSFGLSSKDIVSVTSTVKNLKENTNLSGQAASDMTQRFYGMTHNVKEAESLAKGVGSIADSLHMTGQRADAFSNSLNRVEAGGKVTNQVMNRLEKQAPGVSTAMQKASGMSQKAFDDLVHSGKMTSTQFNDILIKASSSYDKNAKSFNNSADGSMHHLKTAYADTRASLMAPLVSVQNTGLNALSKALDNPQTQSAVKQLGAGIANLTKYVAGLMNYVASRSGSISSIIVSLGQIVKLIAVGAWQAFTSVIKSISDGFNALVGNSQKAHDPLRNVSDILKDISKYQGPIKGIGTALVTAFMASKAIAFGKAIGGVVSAIKEWQIGTKVMTGLQYALDVAMNMNPLGLAVITIGTLVAAFTLAYTKIKPFRNFINGLGKDIGKAFGGIGKILGQLGKAMGKANSDVEKSTSKSIKNMQKGWNNFTKSTAKTFSNIGKTIGKANSDVSKSTSQSVKNMQKDWNGFSKSTSKTFASIGKDAKNKWNGMSKDADNAAKNIGEAFKNAPKNVGNYMNQMQSNVNKVMDNLQKNSPKQMQGMWTSINDITKTRSQLNADLTKTGADLMSGHWNKLSSDIGKTNSDLWNNTSKAFHDGYNWLNDLTGGRLGDVVNAFSNAWNNVTSGIGKLWSWIKDIWNSSIGWVVDKWNGMWSSIEQGVGDAYNSVHHAFVTVVRGVVTPFNELLKGLQDGINWVLDKVGASKITLGQIPVPAYANGTGDTHPGGLAMVNDAKSSNYREMYQFPNGQVGMFPKKRNIITYLPKGTSVLDGERSASLMAMLQMPHYASGIGAAFDSVLSGAKDVMDDIDDVVKDPAGFMTSVFKKFTGGISSKIWLPEQIITHFPEQVAKDAAKWIKKQFEEMAAPAGTGVERWRATVKRALAMNGLSTDESMVNRVLRQIQTESGGNEKVTQGNIGDINNATGDLAKGLMQTISSTFNANAFSGHHNIFNGFDNLLAALNYAKKEYGPSLSYLGNGHGYKNGGLVGQHGLIEIAEGNKPEFVIPTDTANRGRGNELLGQLVTEYAKDVQSGKAPISSTDVLEDKFDKLTKLQSQTVGLLAEIAGLSKDQVKAILNTAQDKQARYREEAKDAGIHNYGNLKGGIFGV
ncbi:tape measure protein [Fructilactobacillus sp. Tb1]|uniref:tape measure protein n=1 Tax=Fructilactobacillus sp. Tb1 TaxID=3422304 RepID=UPI003D2A6748